MCIYRSTNPFLIRRNENEQEFPISVVELAATVSHLLFEETVFPIYFDNCFPLFHESSQNIHFSQTSSKTLDSDEICVEFKNNKISIKCQDTQLSLESLTLTFDNNLYAVYDVYQHIIKIKPLAN